MTSLAQHIRARSARLRSGAARVTFLAAIILCPLDTSFAGAQSTRCALEAPPSVQLGELFRDVQMKGIFQDSKTFADLQYSESTGAILRDYRAHKNDPGFDLKAFVRRHFSLPPERPTVDRAARGQPVDKYIATLWNVLKHDTGGMSGHSSLLPLPHAYVVPGGRFRELYYWDSYFTMLGLEADGRHDLVRDMIEDFAFEIDCYGHVPTGNRSYYLSRSQPPFFSLMVDLLARRDGKEAYVKYLPQLKAEYDYWMDGAAAVAPNQGHRRVVRLADGTLLNRYWDDRPEPRDESYREDVKTAAESGADPPGVYRSLRAGAESGWDFSTRWLADSRHLDTIRTDSLAPVDLNSLMVHLERTIAKAYRIRGDAHQASRFTAAADRRAAAIRRLMWNRRSRMFVDYEWQQSKMALPVTAAGLFPLFFKVANRHQAAMAAQTLRRRLLMVGGVATTLKLSSEQWDYPNGWAPLQWVAVVGLRNYGKRQLAATIARRWNCENLDGYRASKTLIEKYDVVDDKPGGGGEYELQIGFGWTNGVLRALRSTYPELASPGPPSCEALHAARR
jgi:alpha,alpha-trehalase